MSSLTGVGVLDKAMAVVHAVLDEPRTLSELQRTTGLPRATAHRLAGALELHGLLRRTADGGYELGHVLIVLGDEARSRFPLVELAQPILAALRDRTGESVQLFVREGAQRRCVLSLETPHGLRWIVPEGAVFPLDAGSAGRVLDPTTATTGWVESIGEREPGVASVSAAVVDAQGAIVGAISVSGPIERLTERPGDRFGGAVLAAATELSRAIAA